ncbi:Aspartate--tRNA ligase [bacterium HR34]|nr:Aspartate--tRNA ligase [bacterium HR34]
MKEIFNAEAINFIGKNVKVFGWAQTIRSHGKIIFIDLRDRSGLLQVVVTPKSDDYEVAKKVRSEDVLMIEGEIAKRPPQMVNRNIKTGEIELKAEKIEILSKSEVLPFQIDNDGYEIGENHRLKYRYLDLRRERLARNLIYRDKVLFFMRDFLRKIGFIEVETPILTKSTPEGARDYLVPSRLYPGKFYALPQSPQQYKQLLMVAGVERYFQVARCFRDEDPRADRQAEFTQLDMEMSFIQREDIMNLVEELLIKTVKDIFPGKKIQEIPFPRLSYDFVMKEYGIDRPDIRKDKNDKNLLAFCWVVDFPFFEKDENGKWTFTHNPFSAPKPEFEKDLLEKKNIDKILTTQYDIVLNGYEIGGGSIRSHKPELLKSIFEIIGYSSEEIERNFGHMLEAFKYGVPPHGGIALGLDRLLAILLNEPNIREVIPFPKTGDNKDLMMGAPDFVLEEQLKELHIKITKKDRN